VSRTPLIAVLVALALAVVAGITTVVVVFLSTTDGGNPPGAGASASAPPAIRLGLDDQGSAVTLTWNDPSDGKVLFVVAYGRADGPADHTQRLPAGTTTITINGLNPAADYCFTVAGVESTTTIVLSPAVCTKRTPSESPSAPSAPPSAPPVSPSRPLTS
jgi:hypothetical protein